MGSGGTSLHDREYEHLLAFRVALRRFLRWSQEQAAAAGLTPAGTRRGAGLGAAHLEELRRLAALAASIGEVSRPRTAARGRRGP